MTIDTSKYPQTLDACWKLIYRLDRELIQAKSKNKDYGVGVAILREPKNFQLIDSVIEKTLNVPFTFNDFFNKWLDLIGVSEDNQPKKILSDLKQYTKDLLVKNGIIRQVGGNGKSALYRAQVNYNFILRNSKELSWRTKGQDEGTFLMPKKSA